MFVFSSRFEGWGLVVGEAMAAGLPVVSFDCEWGPAEMIEDGHSGFLIPNGDVEAMARSIVTMCQDEDLRRRLADAARVRMQNFTPDRIFAAWQQVITDALVRHRERVEA
jgi:glycosyltransferase involved in cell wall biosynthesis